VIAVVAVAVALFFLLRPEDAGKPSPQGRADVQAPQRSAEQGDADLALRDETVGVARQLLADFPNSTYPLGLMGTVQNAFGNSEAAEEWWLKCLERDPRRTDVYEVLAVAFLRKGEYEKVAELLRKAQAIDPNLPNVHRRHAEALMEMGKLDEALVELQRELKISPRLSENYIVLGKIYLQREDYQESVDAYARSLELRPNDSRAYYGLAMASARLGQSDKAREYMQVFSRLRAKEDEASTSERRATDKPRPAAGILAETLVDAGRMYGENRQSAKAEQCWQRAATLDRTNTLSRQELVKLYRSTRRGQDALNACKQLREIDPGNPSYHLITGVVYAEMNQFDAAEGAVRRAIELAPQEATGYRSLAEVFLRGNRKLPEAKTLAQKAAELAPTARHYSLLSQTCSRNQDPSGALAAMKRAAELDPNNEQIQKAYKNLQERQ
jgi:tetratricopeptide (TPR) repeat protein